MTNGKTGWKRVTDAKVLEGVLKRLNPQARAAVQEVHTQSVKTKTGRVGIVRVRYVPRPSNSRNTALQDEEKFFTVKLKGKNPITSTVASTTPIAWLGSEKAPQEPVSGLLTRRPLSSVLVRGGETGKRRAKYIKRYALAVPGDKVYPPLITRYSDRPRQIFQDEEYDMKKTKSGAWKPVKSATRERRAKTPRKQKNASK